MTERLEAIAAAASQLPQRLAEWGGTLAETGAESLGQLASGVTAALTSPWLMALGHASLGILRDLAPILGILLLFQLLVIRRAIPHSKQIALGFFYIFLGMTIFLEGLQLALFPLGELMARQLTAPEFTGVPAGSAPAAWDNYLWVYLFAGCIGFATALAEPTLIAVAIKASEVSAGSIRTWPLRLAVAGGVGFGLALGTFRIVTGTPLYLYLLAIYLMVAVQSRFAPKVILGLAYDSGAVASSAVTVPIVTALGLGLAAAVPGRDPVLDGFGLIAFTCFFPIISVLGYAQTAAWWSRRARSTPPDD
jgi:hypothetical protein